MKAIHFLKLGKHKFLGSGNFISQEGKGKRATARNIVNKLQNTRNKGKIFKNIKREDRLLTMSSDHILLPRGKS